jgi:2-polyprenyl-3-methyl-5-hydroxy-6-metoxy-1,4-benzoquinol methylase
MYRSQVPLRALTVLDVAAGVGLIEAVRLDRPDAEVTANPRRRSPVRLDERRSAHMPETVPACGSIVTCICLPSLVAVVL